MEGRTRVLSFGDVRLSDAHEQERADSATRVSKHKTREKKRGGSEKSTDSCMYVQNVEYLKLPSYVIYK